MSSMMLANVANGGKNKVKEIKRERGKDPGVTLHCMYIFTVLDKMSMIVNIFSDILVILVLVILIIM